MTYILSAERDADETPGACFRRYREYLDSVRAEMPASVMRLADSPWYFRFDDHRAPHDARLESVGISETPVDSPWQERKVSITIRLLSAYNTGHIELRYTGVNRYRIELVAAPRESTWGLQDWRYDEFRLAADGRFEHEIEWWGPSPTGTWLIEAEEIEHSWHAHPTRESP